MKMIFTILLLIGSLNTFAASSFEAVILKEENVLRVKVQDYGVVPPFDGGALWSSVKGEDRLKNILLKDFKLQCTGFPLRFNDIIGNCTMFIPYNKFEEVGNFMIYKVKGVEANAINRFFNDSAYVSMQSGRVYLSSYNTRREFIFAIQSNLITR